MIEGQDAVGKSTQVDLLAERFRQQGEIVVTMHEPDGDLPQAHVLSELIKNREHSLEPLTYVLLLMAARLELWRKLAEPALKKDGVVISARNWWSTLAYQGYGLGVSRGKITKIAHQVLPAKYIRPTHAVILTLDDQARLARQAKRKRNLKNDVFESKPSAFQQRVSAAYPKIAKQFEVATLDASPAPIEIRDELIRMFGL